MRRLLAIVALILPFAGRADVLSPDEVTGVRVTRAGNDVHVTWDPAVVDAAGVPETVSEFRVYRGTTGSFRADKIGGTNRVGTSPTADFIDGGAAAAGLGHYFYRVSAVDAAGLEGRTRPSLLPPPVLSATWSADQIDTSWTPVLPRAQLLRYRLYWGTASRRYDNATDVPASFTAWILNTLSPNVLYYMAVTSVDRDGNESAFSNEVTEALYGRFTVRAMDQGHSVVGGPNPSNGWEPQSPVDFPPLKAWTKVLVTVTLNSYLTPGCNCAGAGACGGDEWAARSRSTS